MPYLAKLAIPLEYIALAVILWLSVASDLKCLLVFGEH